MSETRDHISVQIDTILLGLPSSPYKPSIFTVPDDLRCLNEKLYEPKILAIGPFHHGKKHLQKMEQHKLRYLKLLLRRTNETSVDKYVVAIRSIEEKARKCYADSIELSPDEFVQMLVLDGLFIVELIRKYAFDDFKEVDDTIFQYEQILSQIRHDLVLVENQIPFFVLDHLFTMTRTGNPDDDILYLIHLFIDDISPWPEAEDSSGKVSRKNLDHFLGLVYTIWCSSFDKTNTKKPVLDDEKTLSINSTTELQEAGVKFTNHTKSNFLDIKFTKGMMKIPRFDVSDSTESILGNLIAYEHFFVDNQRKYVTDYAFFLHCLINSSNDVEILRRHGIVHNLLGDDEMVYRVFNRLGRNILVSSDFYYEDVFDKVNRFSGYRGNRWMANLRHNYFNSPWGFISVFAALMLLMLTFTQTVFSVMSYKKSK